MPSPRPRTELPTHRVENQPLPLGEVDLYSSDPALREALGREGAAWAEERVRSLGELLGSERVGELGEIANRHVPELRSFDAYGRRIDEVRYDRSYHDLMAIGVEHGVPSIAWEEDRPGAHVAHVAMTYLFSQVESGVVCPLTMNYAVVATLRQEPELAAAWEPGILSRRYDPRPLPAAEKAGLMAGMAMTEKQGGSDLRANTTRAEPAGSSGSGEFLLTGHKWFCSAPMSDLFLTLARTERGLSCFLVPRWLPDGARNGISIQRLKDKLGNRSNASSEIEYERAHAWLLGEEGRGVRTILAMVHHTRNDTVAAPAAYMRQALRHALHHVRQRMAFGRRLVEQPLMRRVLADLAVEVEAAVAVSLRIARSFDEAPRDPEGRAFCRIATAVAKYWANKRVAGCVAEALECLGGSGYVEESILPRLYREAPLNGIWEGSGNVICLDVLRALGREPGTREAFLGELERARGADGDLDRAIDSLAEDLALEVDREPHARELTERMAVALQGSLLVRHGPPAVAEAFLRTRVGRRGGFCYGTLPDGVDLDAILERAFPEG